MKILFIDAFTGFGGAQRFNASLLEEFTRLSHTTCVVCRKKAQFRTLYSGKTYTLPFLGDLDIFSFIGLLFIMLREKPDIIHTHSHHDHWLGAMAARILRIPVIHTRHVAFPMKPTLLRRIMYSLLTDCICAVSEYTKKMLLDTFSSVKKFDTAKVVTVPCVFVTRKTPTQGIFRRDLQCGDKKIINYIARIVEGKGHLYFIDAIQRITAKRKDYIGVIVGDGPLRSTIEAYCNEKNMKEHIRFAGFRNDMENVYADSYLTVIASESESLSFTAMDSLYHGVPVVASNVGGIPEVVTHGKTGLLFPVGSVDALAASLESLLNSDEPYATMKKNCHDYRSALDSAPHSAHSFIEVYKKVQRRKA